MAVKFSQFTSIVPTAGTYLVGYDGATNIKVLYSSLIGGSGTTNYLSKWTSSTALGNSLVQDDGTSTGINSSPSASGMVSINRGALTESIILTSSDATNRIRFQNTGNTQVGIIQFSSNGFGIGCGGSYLSAIEIGRTTNHVGIFGSPDASYRLSVGGSFRAIGDSLIRGSGNTGGTTALTVQNSDGTNMFRVRSDNNIFIGSASAAISTGNATNLNSSDGGILYFSPPNNFDNSGKAGIGISILSRASTASTAINSQIFQIAESGAGYAPTSGSLTRTYFQINATINQTGGANGITRGLYVNPTLTAAADWRSIEWSNNSGWGLYGAGSGNNYLQGNLTIGSTTITAGYAIRATGGIYATGNFRFDGGVRDNRDNTIISQSASGVTSNRVLTIANATYLSLVVDNANLLLGSTVDGGQKLQVTGTAKITSTVTIGSTGNPGLINLNRGSNGATMSAIQQTDSITEFYNYQGSGFNFYVAAATTPVRAFIRAGGIGITGTEGLTFTLNASAALQINSSSQGFLTSCMTNAQMVAIATPAAGLMVYDTTNNKLNVYDGTAWVAVH